MDRFKSPEFRAAVYGVFAALALVASVAGVLSSEMLAALLGVVSAGISLLALVIAPGLLDDLRSAHDAPR